MSNNTPQTPDAMSVVNPADLSPVNRGLATAYTHALGCTKLMRDRITTEVEHFKNQDNPTADHDAEFMPVEVVLNMLRQIDARLSSELARACGVDVPAGATAEVIAIHDKDAR